jgi:molybdenum cofactor guanylyltransferase
MEAGGRHSCAGFVLTGGQSSRMGRDKALLELEGEPLVARVAERVRRVAGNVTLIGAAEKYGGLGFPARSDEIENAGPLGGIFTALHYGRADWNLIVACDMPSLTETFLRSLLDDAILGGHTCLVPETSSGLHPLCAVYHRRTLPAAEYAIAHKHLKMQHFLKTIDAVPWPLADEALLENVNTPADWTVR